MRALRHWLNPFFGLAMVTGFAACDDGGRKVDLPVEDSKPVSAVTTDERQAICDAFMPAVKDLMQGVCVIQGLAAKLAPGGTDVACQAAVDKCVQEMNSSEMECAVGKEDKLTTCTTVTVGEIESCVNDMLSLMESTLGGLSCSTTQEELQKLQESYDGEFKPPASCLAISEKCPSAIGFDNQLASGSGD